VVKITPELDDFTQERFNEIMAELDRCESDVGKLRITYSGLSFPVIVEMAVELSLQMKELTKQLDKCFTGA